MLLHDPFKVDQDCPGRQWHTLPALVTPGSWPGRQIRVHSHDNKKTFRRQRMTQHEYVFVAISIILGLAITRLLHTVAMLIRAHKRVRFHWSSATWGLCVMTYVLQFWWVGWGLRGVEAWSFLDFSVLTVGAIFVYGAAEMALPVPDGDFSLDFLSHSQGLGRLSALSMLLYFAVGPYINILLFDNDLLASIALPLLGMILMLLIIARPNWFKGLSVLFAMYSLAIFYLTT